MGRIYVCIGRYAGTPYTIKKAWVHVSCVEELCFYICNNAYLLEDDFFGPELVNWLEEECNLVEIARNLRSLVRQGAKLDVLVRTLLTQVHYCKDSEIDEVEKLLLSSDKISPVDKCKVRADYFLKNQKYVLAQKLYEELKDKLLHDPHPEQVVDQLAQVYHNLGVIYANLFMLNQAGEYFKLAFELDHKQSHMVAYLAACRIQMKDNEYLKHIATVPGAYEASAELEEMLKTTLQEWNVSEEKIRAGGFEHLRQESNLKELDMAVLQQVSVYKDEYRNHMND